MRKCRELSRLPKTKGIKSINVWLVTKRIFSPPLLTIFIQFRNTTPGTLTNVLPYRSHKPTEIVDSSHPAAKLHRSTYNALFPKFQSPHITIRAFPKALLTKPDVVWPNPPYKAAAQVKWAKQVDAFKRATDDTKPEFVNLKSGSLDMSIACIVSKKAIHKSAVIRKQILRRLKSTMGLIVVRDADARELEKTGDSASSKFVLDVGKSEKMNNWILPSMSSMHSFSDGVWMILKTILLIDWTYIIIPTLSIYRMPHLELVLLLRTALRKLFDKGTIMERQWYTGVLPKSGPMKPFS